MIQAAGHMVQYRDIIILKHIDVRLTNFSHEKPSPFKRAILKSLPIHPFIGLKIQTQHHKILLFGFRKNYLTIIGLLEFTFVHW